MQNNTNRHSKHVVITRCCCILSLTR